MSASKLIANYVLLFAACFTDNKKEASPKEAPDLIVLLLA